jgi:DNA mismatch endonuclease (patch repair protein)
MADIFSQAKRSDIMRRVHSKNNQSTEYKLVRMFRGFGITGWRRQGKILGRPDFVFPKLKIAVFVDGCFWHKCPKCFKPPKTNRKFWCEKVSRNHHRDIRTNKSLRKSGWEIIRIWEHELRIKGQIPLRLVRLINKNR